MRSRKVEEFDPRLIVLYTSCFGSQVANQRRHFETQWKHQNSAGFFLLVIDKSRHEHDDHETWTVYLARHEQNQSEQRLQRERGRFAVVSRLEVGWQQAMKK